MEGSVTEAPGTGPEETVAFTRGAARRRRGRAPQQGRIPRVRPRFPSLSRSSTLWTVRLRSV